MPLIITIVNQKGGVGKSTLSMNLYAHFRNEGQRAVLVDFDPQGSNTQLVKLKGSEFIDILNIRDFPSIEKLQEKFNEYEVVVIDTPPYFFDDLPKILGFSNIVLIPCKPSIYDVLASHQTLELIDSLINENKYSFIPFIVMTQVITGTVINGEIREYLSQYKPKILKTEIFNRVAYAEALVFSGDVLSGENKKAKEEIKNLADEILSLFLN
jgi:chromosome partitioning protein